MATTMVSAAVAAAWAAIESTTRRHWIQDAPKKREKWIYICWNDGLRAREMKMLQLTIKISDAIRKHTHTHKYTNHTICFVAILLEFFMNMQNFFARHWLVWCFFGGAINASIHSFFLSALWVCVCVQCTMYLYLYYQCTHVYMCMQLCNTTRKGETSLRALTGITRNFIEWHLAI